MDCRNHSINELSLVIMNDEFLYNKRFLLTQDSLNEMGILFTNEQWEMFQYDLAEEFEGEDFG